MAPMFMLMYQGLITTVMSSQESGEVEYGFHGPDNDNDKNNFRLNSQVEFQ
jgi:hypothetical protein